MDREWVAYAWNGVEKIHDWQTCKTEPNLKPCKSQRGAGRMLGRTSGRNNGIEWLRGKINRTCANYFECKGDDNYYEFCIWGGLDFLCVCFDKVFASLDTKIRRMRKQTSRRLCIWLCFEWLLRRRRRGLFRSIGGVVDHGLIHVKDFTGICRLVSETRSLDRSDVW